MKHTLYWLILKKNIWTIPLTEKHRIESSYFYCASREFVETLTEKLKEMNIYILYSDRHYFVPVRLKEVNINFIARK